jgi:hypothetical protein
MDMRRICTVVIAAAIAAGCTSERVISDPGTTTTRALTLQQRADAACEKAAPVTLFSSLPTTAGAIHHITGGPPHRDGSPTYGYKWLLPKEPDAAFAAWCWTKVGLLKYELLVVGANGQVQNSGQGVTGEAPHGRGPLQPS